MDTNYRRSSSDTTGERARRDVRRRARTDRLRARRTAASRELHAVTRHLHKAEDRYFLHLGNPFGDNRSYLLDAQAAHRAAQEHFDRLDRLTRAGRDRL